MNRATLTFVASLAMTAAGSASALTCEQQGNIAAGIMKSHQLGVPLANIIKQFSIVSDPAAKQALEDMAVRAYDQPRYSTESMQQRAIGAFRDEAVVECYRIFGK